MTNDPDGRAPNLDRACSVRTKDKSTKNGSEETTVFKAPLDKGDPSKTRDPGMEGVPEGKERVDEEQGDRAPLGLKDRSVASPHRGRRQRG